ncbi:transcription factor bHLH25-like [Phoenix dactylifera]|uniref:Transcription factor bHLH25-like n=1 Tax=Phoenix dactylifera TaxID=42345 RepID=A0A8B8ZGI6_PHODC|nr:transcription factor bHLH25-like [Phoenix dactylifera]
MGFLSGSRCLSSGARLNEMEISENKWSSELVMDESSFIYECDISSFNEFTPQRVAPALVGGFQQPLSSESYTSYPPFNPVETPSRIGLIERPKKIQKINSWNSRTTEQNPTLGPDASSADSLLFRNSDSPNDELRRASASQENMRALVSNGSAQDYETLVQQGSKMIKTGSMPSQAHDEHVIAERKRREKLSLRFIELSAVIPGLKKRDKASVLEEAAKYVKQLEARVKTIEDQTAKRTVESVVLVRKSKLSADADGSSSSGCPAEKPLPDIEAMLSEKTVLIRIHCKNHRGVLARLVSEIENVHLTVTNASVMPFPRSSIHITMTAKVEEEFSMALGELVRKLNSALS